MGRTATRHPHTNIRPPLKRFPRLDGALVGTQLECPLPVGLLRVKSYTHARRPVSICAVGSDECCRSVFDWQKLGWILRCGARRVKHQVLQRLAAHSTMLCVSPGQCTIHLILRRCRRPLVRREVKINKRLRAVRISWAELHQFHA